MQTLVFADLIPAPYVCMYCLCYVNLDVGSSRVGLHGTELFDCTSTFEIVDSIPVPSMEVSVQRLFISLVCNVACAEFLFIPLSLFYNMCRLIG